MSEYKFVAILLVVFAAPVGVVLFFLVKWLSEAKAVLLGASYRSSLSSAKECKRDAEPKNPISAPDSSAPSAFGDPIGVGAASMARAQSASLRNSLPGEPRPPALALRLQAAGASAPRAENAVGGPQLAPLPRAIPQQTSPPAFLDPLHFSRHAGLPGYVYLARNDHHRTGVHKIGYTLGTPDARAHTLNLENRKMRGLGTYKILFAAPARAAYDVEQMLFRALAQRRITNGREFFFSDERILRSALSEAVEINLADEEARVDWIDRWASSFVQHVEVPPDIDTIDAAAPGGGWIYIFSPHWYEQPLYYACCTRLPARRTLDMLRRRSAGTALLDGYSLVHAEVVDDVVAARRAWGKSTRHLRAARGQSGWLRAELPALRLIAAESARAPGSPRTGQAPPARTQRSEGADVSLAVVARAHPQWAAWCLRCGCGALLRVTGKIGAAGSPECPGCGRPVRCEIHSSGVVVIP